MIRFNFLIPIKIVALASFVAFMLFILGTNAVLVLFAFVCAWAWLS